MNPQTLHIASAQGCGSVALDEHIKGDSKTYLILLNQVVCISVVKTSVKVISYKPRLLIRAWLVLPSKDALETMPIKKIQEKVWQVKALAFAKTQQAT
jgi:hypothetical protein